MAKADEKQNLDSALPDTFHIDSWWFENKDCTLRAWFIRTASRILRVGDGRGDRI